MADAAETAPAPVLITLPLSHFCEKARWGMQRYGIAFSEDGHAPLFHMWAVQSAGGKGSVPVLKLPPPEGACVDGSTAILRWVDERTRDKEALPRLFPADTEAEVTRLCDLFDTKLGPATRRWAYSYLLFKGTCLEAITAPPVPMFESIALHCGLWYLIRSRMATVSGALLPSVWAG